MIGGPNAVSACTPEGDAPRKAAFLKQHPEWSIGLDHSVGIWRGYRDLPNGLKLHCRYELKDLLDRLEQVAAQDAQTSL